MGQDVDPECTKSVRVSSVYATGGQMMVRIEVSPLDISRVQIEDQLPRDDPGVIDQHSRASDLKLQV
jgi:hypothetical protein